jgi:hypothetical protein
LLCLYYPINTENVEVEQSIASTVLKRQQKWQDFAMVMFSGDRPKHYAYQSFYIGIDNVKIANQN